MEFATDRFTLGYVQSDSEWMAWALVGVSLTGTLFRAPGSVVAIPGWCTAKPRRHTCSGDEGQSLQMKPESKIKGNLLSSQYEWMINGIVSSLFGSGAQSATFAASVVFSHFLSRYIYELCAIMQALLCAYNCIGHPSPHGQKATC
jgi:hypothetical protein